jgi:glycosyltransferase involved in cell wall biosynthesis
MQSKIKISYILTTFNKYAYLKITLPYIISQLLPDEELVIIDGKSKDETVGFIQEQVKNKANIFFLSEEDKGESDGLNKALSFCKGKIIKNLTDDDAFSFYAVREAATYMLAHEIDIMGFDGFGLSLHLEEFIFGKTNFKNGFDVYLSQKKPFFFCGLSYLIKKSDLPSLGLFSTEYKMVDLEYSFRISSRKCKIGWSNLLTFVNIYNANSNTLLFNKRLEKESLELHKKYCPGKKYYAVLFRFKLQRLLEFKNKLIKRESFGKTNKLNFEKGFLKSLETLEKENRTLEKIIFYS